MGERVDRTNTSDEALMGLAAKGDEDAFLSLYHRRQASIYRFALHMSGNAATAEEVTQEVFLAVIEAGDRNFCAAKGSGLAYLFGVARNHVLRHLEKSQRYVGLEQEDRGTYAEEAAVGDDTLSDLTRAETVESVRRAVLSLPAVYREVVALCELEEMSYADAAEALKVPLGTVRSRLSRARGLLGERLRKAEGVLHEPRS